MEKITNGRFQFSYEKRTSTRYFVLEFAISEKIYNYQVEMLTHNPHDNILPLIFLNKDGKGNFYYNITSMVPLSFVIQNRKLKKKEFARILSAITKTILESKSYLLTDKSFLFDEDYIFVNTETLQPSLVYIPIEIELDSEKEFKNLLGKLVTDVKIEREPIEDDKEGDVGKDINSKVFLEKFSNEIRSNRFSIASFNIFLDKLYNGTTPSLPVQSMEKEKPVQQPAISPSNLVKESKSNLVSEFEKTSRIETGKSARMDTEEDAKNIGIEDVNLYKHDSKKSLGKILLWSLLQLSTVAASIYTVVSGKIRLINKDRNTSYLVLTLIFIILSFLIWKLLLGRKRKGVQENTHNYSQKDTYIDTPKNTHKSIHKSTHDSTHDSTPDSTYKDSYESSGEKSAREVTPDITLLNSKPEKEKQTRKKADIEPIWTDGINLYKLEIRTVPYVPESRKEKDELEALDQTADRGIINENANHFAYMEMIKNDLVERVTITKSNFKIGRQKSQVNHLALISSIEKVHAEIIYRNGVYFIKDLNTKNGTFINDSRIENGKEYEVKDSDKLRLASQEYTFYTNQIL